MCDECVKLDQKIENYRRMIVRVSDPLTTEAVERLIKGIQAQKAALHAVCGHRGADVRPPFKNDLSAGKQLRPLEVFLFQTRKK